MRKKLAHDEIHSHVKKITRKIRGDEENRAQKKSPFDSPHIVRILHARMGVGY